jgi:hypothetical protein
VAQIGIGPHGPVYSTFNRVLVAVGISSREFSAEFNGRTRCSTGLAPINGKTYSKSFGLTLSAIAVTGITADTTGYTF